ncbi:MAG: hypothetical protein BRC47_09845 [Cyanobacteria bacterium QS_7_48_42]|nr:MAG: hypothetical protein BRC39_15105 [Cyanobacteria bacterium QH_7_48_89]PSP01325.1 MAG: hypothetical protein BRC47_09845 [Cyanobacteria bacterium QS_7_48_42]
MELRGGGCTRCGGAEVSVQRGGGDGGLVCSPAPLPLCFPAPLPLELLYDLNYPIIVQHQSRWARCGDRYPAMV